METWEHMNPYQFCEGLTDTGVGAAEDDAARGIKPDPEACTSSTHCANQTTAVNLKLLILISSLLQPQPILNSLKASCQRQKWTPSVAVTRS